MRCGLIHHHPHTGHGSFAGSCRRRRCGGRNPRGAGGAVPGERPGRRRRVLPRSQDDQPHRRAPEPGDVDRRARAHHPRLRSRCGGCASRTESSARYTPSMWRWMRWRQAISACASSCMTATNFTNWRVAEPLVDEFGDYPGDRTRPGHRVATHTAARRPRRCVDRAAGAGTHRGARPGHGVLPLEPRRTIREERLSLSARCVVVGVGPARGAGGAHPTEPDTTTDLVPPEQLTLQLAKREHRSQRPRLRCLMQPQVHRVNTDCPGAWKPGRRRAHTRNDYRPS